MHGTPVERGKPEMLPGRESGPQGPPIASPVEEEGGSESWSVIDQIEGATFPHAKASRLPSGLSARERLSNRLRR
jgi:hypothetical protein